MSKEKFTESITELKGKIAQIEADLNALVTDIDEAEAAKVCAKDKYAVCLDCGDEEGMSKCLKTVRDKNAIAESKRKQFLDFSPQVSALSSEQEALMKSVRKETADAEAAVKKAQATLQIASCRVGQVQALAPEIGRLDIFIQDHRPRRQKQSATECADG